jgi:hypothetical protein
MNVRSFQFCVTSFSELGLYNRADDKEKEKFEDLHRSISVGQLANMALAQFLGTNERY